MNPCKNKGEAKNKQVCVGEDGRNLVHPCECLKVRVALYPKLDGMFLRYGILEKGDQAGETVKLKGYKPNGNGAFRTVPCFEAFRHLDSQGTKKWRKLKNSKSKFLGCDRLEKNLEEEKLVRVVPAEKESSAWHDLEGKEKEPQFSLPSPNEFLDSYDQVVGYAIELALDPSKRKLTALMSVENHSGPTPRVSELLRLPPVDINHAQLRRLYARGAFDGCLKLKVTAYLLCRNITAQWLISEIMPHYDYGEFALQRKRIEQMVVNSLPDRLRRLKRVWSELTPRQRTALRLRYDRGLKLKDCARSVGITMDSFRDRLELAVRKLEKAFPEYKRPPKKPKPLPEEIQPVKYYRRQTDKTELIEINDRKATPWGPPKDRKKVDKAAIYRWLDKVCPPELIQE